MRPPWTSTTPSTIVTSSSHADLPMQQATYRVECDLCRNMAWADLVGEVLGAVTPSTGKPGRQTVDLHTKTMLTSKNPFSIRGQRTNVAQVADEHAGRPAAHQPCDAGRPDSSRATPSVPAGRPVAPLCAVSMPAFGWQSAVADAAGSSTTRSIPRPQRPHPPSGLVDLGSGLFGIVLGDVASPARLARFHLRSRRSTPPRHRWHLSRPRYPRNRTHSTRRTSSTTRPWSI